MKRNNRRRSGWVVLVVIALSVILIGAGERVPPEGPLALFYAQIHALFVETGLLAAESDDQHARIDQLTSTVCELSALTGNSAPPELCEVVVTEACDFDESVVCVCDPGDYFELESCEPVDLVSCYPSSFPNPDSDVVPPPKCDTVKGCRGTFTRTAAGDVGSIEVDPNCKSGGGGPSGNTCSPDCPTYCLPGTGICVPPF
jgi:hypothetical protein